MKKALKVFKIIAIALLIALPVAALVCYLVVPNETKAFFGDLITLVNQPLPIIGVSTIAVLFFAYKVFVSTKYGKKVLGEIKEEVKSYKEKYDDKCRELEEKKHEIECLVNAHQSEIDLLKGYLEKVCSTSTNQKIKQIGYELVGAYQEKKDNIIKDLNEYSNDTLAFKENIKTDELRALESQFDTKLEQLKKELLGYGKETVNSDTEEE